MQFTVDTEMRRVALELATKAYTSGISTVTGGTAGGSHSPADTVARAKTYYQFLKKGTA